MKMKILFMMTMMVLIAAFAGCASSTQANSAAAGGADGAQAPVYDADLTAFAYPDEVKYFVFSSQGQDMRMAYMDIAPEGAKLTDKVYVLFHGKNFSGFYFKEIIEYLSRNSYRVIVVDQVGFGKSTKPQNYQYSFQALSANTHELLQSLGIARYHLLGHSMGGMLAIRHALSYPEEVRGLALINPIGLEDWKTMTPYRTVQQQYQSELANTVDKARTYQKENYYAGEWKDSYEQLLTPLKGWLNGPDRARLAWNAALTSDMVYTQPVIYEVNRLTMPVVLVLGTRDRTAIGKPFAPAAVQAQMGRYDRLGKEFRKRNPRRVRLIEINGLGHVPFIEDPARFWKAAGSAILFR